MRSRRSELFLSIPNIDEINTLYVAASLLPIAVISKIALYWRMQFVTAGMVGGIPKNSKVVELDAEDGKNVFYLPSAVEYTAIMSPGNSPEKVKEKSRINEQLILECIGKANRYSCNEILLVKCGRNGDFISHQRRAEPIRKSEDKISKIA